MVVAVHGLIMVEIAMEKVVLVGAVVKVAAMW